MQILLFILKIIGVLLAVLLGIVLLLILAAAFAPVRYQLKGAWHQTPSFKGRVSWLFPVLILLAEYKEKEEIALKLKLFGFTLWSTGQKDSSVASDFETKDTTKRGPETGDFGAGNFEAEDQAARRIETENSETEYFETEDIPVKKEKKDGRQKEKQKKKKGRFKAFLIKLKRSFWNVWRKQKEIQKFFLEKKEWLEDEKNQASVKFLFQQAKKLIAHIWPLKGRATITFGFEDPYITGQVLSAVSLIYPFYHRQLTLYPIFGESVLDGEGMFKGRIRVWNLLWILFGIYRDKHTWSMVLSLIR